jgi:hypothetical protein
VRCDEAPFDHPSLLIPHGHHARDSNRDGKADDILFELPAVGKGGYKGANKKFCIDKEADGNLFGPGMLNRVGGKY